MGIKLSALILGLGLWLGAPSPLSATGVEEEKNSEPRSLNDLSFFERIRPQVLLLLQAKGQVEEVLKSLGPNDYKIKALADALYLQLEVRFDEHWNTPLGELEFSPQVLRDLEKLEIGDFDSLTPRLAFQELLYKTTGALLIQKSQEIRTVTRTLPGGEDLYGEIKLLFETDLLDTEIRLAERLSRDDYALLADFKDAMGLDLKNRANLRANLRTIDQAFADFAKIFFAKSERAARDDRNLSEVLLKIHQIDADLAPQSSELCLKLRDSLESMAVLKQHGRVLNTLLGHLRIKSQSLLRFTPARNDRPDEPIWPLMELQRQPRAQLMIMGQSLYLADYIGKQIRLRRLKALIDMRSGLEILVALQEPGIRVRDFGIKSAGRFDLFRIHYNPTLEEGPYSAQSECSFTYTPARFEAQQELRAVSAEEKLALRQDFENFLNEAFMQQPD